MAGVDALVPGLSTMTRYARYYGLYWALADHAARQGLGRDQCRQLVRRCEVGLAMISQAHDELEGWPGQAHGLDGVARRPVAEGESVWVAAERGSGSYSPREWGFWSQYNGPSAVLGTVSVDGGALRPGRHRHPAPVRTLFAPLIELAHREHVEPAEVAALEELRLQQDATQPDLEALAGLFTATRNGRHDPDDWVGDDLTRRASLRILARSGQLHTEADTWTEAFASAVAYGSAIRDDPVLVAEHKRVCAWRGILLRHYSVGAWRRLWAMLVDEVHERVPASRVDLHDWISGQLPEQTVSAFEGQLPRVVDAHGDPRPAEQEVVDQLEPVVSEVAVLLLGAQRLESLSGLVRATYLGRRQTYLDPRWVAQLSREYQSRSLPELGRRLVDDMLAQSRRVAMRKLKLYPDGTMALFSRLHERNGWYLATSQEGRGNVGLRLAQLSDLAAQLDLLDDSPPVTTRGRTLLGMG